MQAKGRLQSAWNVGRSRNLVPPVRVLGVVKGIRRLANVCQASNALTREGYVQAKGRLQSAWNVGRSRNLVPPVRVLGVLRVLKAG